MRIIPDINYLYFAKWGLGVTLFAASLGCKPRSTQDSELAAYTRKNAVAPEILNGSLVLGEVALTGNRNVLAGYPVVSGASGQSDLLIVSRAQYVVAFNTMAKVPRWTAWQVKSSDIGDTARPDEFLNDDILNDYLKLKRNDIGVSPTDYTNSCFDKGHQSPAKDRSDSVKNTQATFYMSNMAPQTAFLNRGIWKSLEAHTQKLAEKEHKRLQVVSGPILRDGRENIGPEKDITVPDSFFKIVLVYSDNQAKKPEGYVAVIMPNVTSNGLDPLANRDENCRESTGSRSGGSMANDWQSYKVTLSDVQAASGLSFPELQGVAAL